MSELSLNSIPRLAAGYRFQWEEVQQTHVLLYPEGMVQLNDTAAAVLGLCDGKRAVKTIIEDIERDYETEGLQDDVWQFLVEAQAEGWVRYG